MKRFHVHLHVDDLGKSVAFYSRLFAAEPARTENDYSKLEDEGATSCCYARSDKYWITDPQGIAWEHFRTLENIPVFSEKPAPAAEAAACCAPRGKPVGVAVKSSCC